MQKWVLDTLGLSQSVTIEDPDPSVNLLDYKWMSALFVKYMSKLLRRGENIGSIKMELPEYTIQITKVDEDIVVLYLDKNNNALFTVDRSKKAIYESLGALYESGVFD